MWQWAVDAAQSKKKEKNMQAFGLYKNIDHPVGALDSKRKSTIFSENWELIPFFESTATMADPISSLSFMA
jgi:hypothetical protein